MSESEIKRMNYFDLQFLEEADFTTEQDYHLGMRRRHNRLLHTPGIAEGLQVEKTDAKAIKVRPGTAVDVKGQEIVQFSDFTIDLSNATNYPANSHIYITIAYSQKETDPQPLENPRGFTRTTEKPVIEAKTTAPPTDGTVIQLAKFELDSNGNVLGNVGDELDGDVRVSVGPVLADNAVSIKKLKKELILEATVSLGPGGKQSFAAFTAPLSAPNSAFLLIYAYSTTAGAKFQWEQEYTTVGTAPNLSTTQTVTFKNSGTNSIEVKFKIYAVLES